MRSPCHATEAQPGRDERLAELAVVVPRERVAALGECRVGERVLGAVEALEPRHVDDRVVHLAAFGVPRHVATQRGIQLVRTADPARPQVDPCGVVELASAHGAEGMDDHLVGQVEQRPLEYGHGATIDAIRTDVHNVAHTLRCVSGCRGVGG